MSKDALIVNKMDVVAAIGKVINTTRIVESRNDRLTIIVDTTTELLEVTDVTVNIIFLNAE